MAANDEKWMRYLGHAVAVFSTTGEVPSGSGHPGPWVGAQRSAATRHASHMTADRQALLDEHLPGWRESPMPPPRAWSESAADLSTFVRESERLPRQNGDTDSERFLGVWLSKQRKEHHAGELSAECATWLSAHIPRWEGRGPRELVWQLTVEELGAWVESGGRWPNRRSSDAGERRLATWLKNRRDDDGAGRLSVERVAILDEWAPGWRN